MPKRILVTGGAGFIGSHLCERLVTAGHHVVCLDDFSTATSHGCSALLGRPNFELVRHDVTAPFNVVADEIYNLACAASPAHYRRDPVQTTKTCVYGAINVLELAHRTGARVLQASTSEVYGDPLLHPQVEEHWGNVNPIGSRACYDEGKRCAESLFFDYERTHGVSIAVARIFNTYGPRMSCADGRVISNFIVQALSGTDLTLYGGYQTRSFCYIDDLVDGLLLLMDSGCQRSGPINLGFPRECTIRELAERVILLTSSESRVVVTELPEDDPCRRRPNIDRARARLGWEPRVDIEEGLMKTIDYFALQLVKRTSSGVRFLTAEHNPPTPV